MNIIIPTLFIFISFLIIVSIIGIILISKRNFKYKFPLILVVGEYSIDNLTKSTTPKEKYRKVILLAIINVTVLILTFSFIVFTYISAINSNDFNKPIWPILLNILIFNITNPLIHIKISKLLK